MDPLNISAKFDVRSFMHSWDNREHFKNLGSPFRSRVRRRTAIGMRSTLYAIAWYSVWA